MRRLFFVLVLASACTGTGDSYAPRSFEFGPFELSSGEEIPTECVQITLHNEEDLYINSVELTTGPGFHHSNWFFVPERTFAGDDGTYECDDRNFNEPVAAIFGGVLFAQSTQSPHEIQQFPEGVVLKIPKFSKIVGQVHLLNPTETALDIHPTIAITPIDPDQVVTTLAGMSFENHALALPPNMQSQFTVECDLQADHQRLFGRDPDFKIYYALAHYHDLGTGLDVEAIRPDGTADTVFSTRAQIGDTLGRQLDPVFDMTGHTKLRFSCDFYNPRPDVVHWGIGDQEMCVFLAFTDSTYSWGGGVTDNEEPQNPEQVGNAMHYQNPCTLFTADATR